MFFINQYSHVPFLTRELRKLLSDGSFASRRWRAIGSDLHYWLVDWPSENETTYSSLAPVDALFFWATQDGGLDPEWLPNDDVNLDDDGEEVIPSTVKPTYSATELLAAICVVAPVRHRRTDTRRAAAPGTGQVEGSSSR